MLTDLTDFDALEELWEDEEEEEEVGEEDADDSDDGAGDGDDGAEEDADGESDDGDEGDDDKPLGPAGEKALAAWKKEAKDAKAALKEAQRQLERQNMDEDERALDDAREEGRQEVLAEVNSRLFRSELRAAVNETNMTAKARQDLLADPDTAVRLLGLESIPVTSDGDIDSEAISQAVSSYLEDRPYLSGGARPQGGADQGARNGPRPKTLDEKIFAAESDGDWATARRLKLQKLALSEQS